MVLKASTAGRLCAKSFKAIGLATTSWVRAALQLPTGAWALMSKRVTPRHKQTYRSSQTKVTMS